MPIRIFYYAGLTINNFYWTGHHAWVILCSGKQEIDMEIKEEAFCHVDAYKLFHDGVKLQVRKKGWPNLKWQDSVIAEMFGWGDISYYEFRRKPIELEDGAWYPVVAVSSGQRHVARFNGNKELFESGLLSFEVDNFKIGEQLEINWPE